MRWLVSVLMVGFTLLMIQDFFPATLLAIKIPQGIIIGTILVIFICISFFSDKEKEKERGFKWNIFTSFYVIFLIVLLSLLGGQSTSGISLDSPIVWALFFISVFKIYEEFKRRQSKKSQEI
ncbi:hypothetical protein HU147_16800 [Planomicrobium chinense]|uniref:hypothetical protein n=1 Tax=Planococcus chinensis TaxID=272917 RepID=UPI001CC6BD66|nr:hypothetical protein [Planococcus chinensis]MBZ5202868.1 hypothetical protein [Planococcus chinensis]